MRKLLTFVGAMSISLSAVAASAVDNSTTIHFSGQEISMQVRHQKNMNINAMCFLIGSTGQARKALTEAIAQTEEDTVQIEQMEKLSAQIDRNVSKLADLCDNNGKVHLGSAVQPLYSTLEAKISASEVPQLMKQISDNADKIVRLNIDMLKEKNKAQGANKVADCDEVNGEGMICLGK